MTVHVKQFVGTRNDLDRWRPQIEKALALAGGVLTFDHVAARVDAARYVLLANPESCMLLDVVDWPNAREVHIFLGCGTQAGLNLLVGPAEQFARMIGAKRITSHARKGFTKRLTPGWRHTANIYAKEV